MLYSEARLDAALKQGAPVYYFYGLDAFLLQRAAKKALDALTGQQADGAETELTRLDGPAPDIGELVMAAGAISLFGTRRILWMPLLQPTGYSDKDLDALCDLLASAENAVFVLTTQFADKKALTKMARRAERLVAQCEALGYAAQLPDATPGDITALLQQRAGALGVQLSPAAARAMAERCGHDLFLLENELDKLAAASGYTEITPALVAQLGTQNLEADVFEMIRLLNGHKAVEACRKLQTLRRAQNEPIPIAAAMIGSYLDLYRVKAGQEAGRPYGAVFRDFGYRGSDYRLKMAAETAARYTKRQLAECLVVLQQLDTALKSSPVDDDVLLEQALCQLAAVGAR